MKWTYRVTAAARPRLVMRIAQVFDQQMLEIDRLEAKRLQDATMMRIEVRCEEHVAHRIHAKLYRLADVAHVLLSNDRRVVIGGGVPNPVYAGELRCDDVAAVS